jgi:hypothetical protein
MKLRWDRLGGQLGVGLAVLGLLLIFFGWNGAASYDRVPAQFPYLISGGIAGLALVVFGSALLVVQNARQDRSELQQTLIDVHEALERLTATTAAGSNGAARLDGAVAAEEHGLVVAGGSAYHRTTCKLIEGHGVLPTMTVAAAEAAGLSPCRACDAADLALPVAERDPAISRRRSGRR